jgi:hypothetical protein
MTEVIRTLAFTLLFAAHSRCQKVSDTSGIDYCITASVKFSLNDSVVANVGNEWWRGTIVGENSMTTPYNYQVRWCSIPSGQGPETTISANYLRSNSITDCFNIRGACRAFISGTRGTFCNCGWSKDGGKVCVKTQLDPAKMCGDGVTVCAGNWDIEELSQVATDASMKRE